MPFENERMRSRTSSVSKHSAVFRLCEASVGNLLFIALEVPVLNSLFEFSYCCETKKIGKYTIKYIVALVTWSNP